MSAQQARDNFGELISSVYFTKEPVLVEKKGKPYAVMINPDEYEELIRREAAGNWAVIQELGELNRDIDPDELMRDATEAVEAVREERFRAKIRADARHH